MADLANFKTRFPEFAAAGLNDPMLQAYLDDAIAQIDVSSCGTLSDQIIYLLTAQALALSPSGNTATLVNRDGSTVYDERLARVMSQAVGTIRAV